MREKAGERQQKIKHSIKWRIEHNSSNGLELASRWDKKKKRINICSIGKCQSIIHNSDFMFHQLRGSWQQHKSQVQNVSKNCKLSSHANLTHLSQSRSSSKICPQWFLNQNKGHWCLHLTLEMNGGYFTPGSPRPDVCKCVLSLCYKRKNGRIQMSCCS